MIGGAKITGIKNLTDNLEKILSNRQMFEDAMLKGGVFAEGEAKKNAPKQTRTLARSINAEIIPTFDRTILVGIGTNIIYARIHELGGTIKAKKGQYLKFFIKGKFIQVKQVTIPARPYLTPAIEDNVTEIEKIIGEELRRQISKMDFKL
jgi:HK97 gp10 family phage protein